MKLFLLIVDTDRGEQQNLVQILLLLRAYNVVGRDAGVGVCADRRYWVMELVKPK